MQINNSRPADFYPLTQANNRNVNRTPVVFDASKTLNFVPAIPSPTRLNQVEPVKQTDEQTSARFIREFNAEKAAQNEPLPQREPNTPKALGTYVDIDTIPTTSESVRGQYLNEVV
jgi:hypothetical protein